MADAQQQISLEFITLCGEGSCFLSPPVVLNVNGMLQSIVSLKQNALSGHEYRNSTQSVLRAAKYYLKEMNQIILFVGIALIAVMVAAN